MSQKPVVLVSTTHYLPGFRAGGPIKSMQAIVEQLGSEFDFRIVTEDRDLKVDRPYEGIEQNRWNPGDRCSIFYRSPEGPPLKEVFNQVEYDLLYINSFFSPIFSVSALRAHRALGKKAPVLIAPRGEFQTDALAQKRMRKKVYLSATKSLGWYRDVIWHAASEQEKSEITRVWGSSARIFTALDAMPAIVEESLPEWSPRQPEEPFRVVFLGRIAPVKNLLGAIDALSRLLCPATLTVYGPEEDIEYAKACRDAASRLTSHLKVEFAGMLAPDRVLPSLVEHQAMLFPSTGESFGHVIGEGLLAGLPVVISDRTPWNWVQDAKAGFVFALEDTAGMAAALTQLSKLSAERFEELRHHCRTTGITSMTDATGIADTKQMFWEILKSLGKG
jgi:glycosyltransferase involved in cell wall biosynthesis